MRLPLRQVVFWLHLSAAVLAGLVILTMAATGLALSFEAQVLAWADRAHRHVEPPAAGGALLPERLLGTVAAARPEIEATAVTVRRDPREAWTVALGREGVLYVDPYTGEVIGPGATRVRRAMRWLTDLHRYLAASGEARERGKAITGSANLVFLFVLASGLYIWVPRVWSRLHVHNALWFRRGVRAKVRDFNWHHVFGIWALLPLLAIVASAAPISYRWAGDLVMRLTGSPPPAEASSPTRPGAAGGGTPGALAPLDLSGLDRAVHRATATVPGWRSLTVRLPPRDEGWAVSVDRADRRGRPDLRDALVVDRDSGQVAEHEPFAAQSLGRRARSWMRWIHTGEAGGLAGQAVGALACMATLLLGWTGYALALRRLFAWRRRRAFARASVAAVVSPARDAGLSPQTLSNSLPIPPEG